MLNLTEKKDLLNSRDISMKLHGTYTCYDNEFYYTEVSSTLKLHLYPIIKDKSIKKKIVTISDPKWNIKFPKLGYLNFLDSCKYICRSPGRTNKIALANNQLYAYNTFGERYRISFNQANSSHTTINNFFQGKQNCSFEEGLEKLKSENQDSFAISNNICLFKGQMSLLHVAYKNTTIGWISTKNKKPTLIVPEEHSQKRRIQIALQTLILNENLPTEVLANV